MIKVDEVYPIDINTTIGPTGTIKRLFRNREYFRKRGYEMTIFANHPIGKRILTYKYAMKELRSLPEQKDGSIMADSINTNKWKNRIKSKFKKIVEGNKWLAAYAFNRRIGVNKVLVSQYLGFDRHPDIVIFHEFDSCYHFYKQLNGKSDAKTAVFIHADGSDDGMFRKTHPILIGTTSHRKHLERLGYVYSHADRVVFISDLAKQRFCDAHPEYAIKAVSVVNGIEDIIPIEDASPSTNHKFRLVSTGSVCARKGQYLVVEAMHKMRHEILKNTHFTVIGTGPDYSMLKELVSQYRLHDHITFIGNKPNREIHRLLARENIYVLMSNNEGLPISILEAMRAGLPVISTKIAGIPEEVDERNGLLIYPEVEQLVGLLNQLPNYDWVMLGKNSRKRFEEKFTFNVMRRKYADLFDGMLRE